MMHDLKKMLQDIVCIKAIPNIDVKGLSLDSRSVSAGDLFFDCSSVIEEKEKHIKQAIENGAAAILSYGEVERVRHLLNVPVITVPNLINEVGFIAARFYSLPSKDMFVIGVTGTNGKTSTSYLLAQALQKLKNNAGFIGTIGYGLVDKLQSSIYTTPDPILLQKIFYEFKQQKINVVVMEVSSHGLEQGRVNGVDIDLGIFTNLTHDHLDYHGSMEAYQAAKRKLFEMPALQCAVFNLDDKIGYKWFDKFQNKKTVFGYTIDDECLAENNIVAATDVGLQENGVQAVITYLKEQGKLSSNLMGKFNVSNLLAIISALLCMKYKLSDILKIIPTLKPVPGRMQTFGGGHQPLVVIDFSHTPDALEKALETLREHCDGKLLCVFGCGGDRDREKRPKMAQVAEKFADKVIVTDDNVRCENPQQIIEDILVGFKNVDKVQVERDRTQAIKSAISQAQVGDIVLFAGKGHEEYQIVGDKKLPFSEKAIIIQELGMLKE